MANTRKKVYVLVFVIAIHLGMALGNTLELKASVHEANVFTMQQEQRLGGVSHVKKRSLRHLVVKRAAGPAGALDEHCQSQEETLQGKRTAAGSKFATIWQFGNETKYSMALAWAGENNKKILVATTEELMLVFMLTAPSTLYQSVDGGSSFENITTRIDNSRIRRFNGLQKDPHNPARVFIVTYHQAQPSLSRLYITKDGGDHFKMVTLPFLLEGSIIFHPDKTHSDLLLVRSQQNNKLYLSQDGGEVWKAIRDKVVHFKWGAPKENAIYATVDPQNTAGTDNTLVKTEDLGNTWSQLLKHTYTFGKEGKFLFATVQRPNSYGERLMEVSTTAGKTWNEAQLPTITEDRFYSILDMSEGLIFMHVDAPGDTGHGTLYTSDSSGIIFSESLEKHLYPNFQEVTDFYKVNSMRGVYLASQLELDNSIHTMITFNRGSTWQPVKRPEGVPCKDESKACYLQIHNSYSITRLITATPPISVSNAPGLIIVHGHVADALQTTTPDVFISSDGGYTWYKSLDGPHYIQIADHGGLLVAVSKITPTPDTIKFSTDEGRCWHLVKYTDQKVMFTGLLTEPGNRAMSVGVWGFGQEDKIWRVHTFNFTTIITRQCDNSTDYEDWLAHGDNTDNPKFKGCLLGRVEKFRRLKKDSLCTNGYSYEVSKSLTTCECRREDYECDYGFRRSESSDVCSENPEFGGAHLDVCILGHEEEVITKGYRKVPGDVCKGGFTPQGDKIVNLTKQCQMGNKNVIHSEIAKSKKSQSSAGGNALLISIVLLVLVLAVICVVYFVKKFNILRRATVTYRYSSLNQTEDNDQDNDFENALASNSLYEDTSDEAGGFADITSQENELTSKVVTGYSTLSPTSETARLTPGGASSQNGSVPRDRASHGRGSNPLQPHLRSYHDDSDVDMLE